MTATRLWARNELGRRWRALVVLGLIAGAAGGLALGAFVQAQRSADVYARYREATASPVADSTPLLYVAPIAGLAIALAVPGTLAVANALAALPARRAFRLRAVDVLRTE